MDYFLMNKDDKLLAFRTEAGPLGTTVRETASYSDRRPHGWKGIERWVESRNRARRKKHLRPMLRGWELDTPDGFLQVSHALGLNDTLWVKPEASVLRWADVCLYSNPFDDVAARTAFETGLHGLELPSTSPEFTAEGSYPKCWRGGPDGIVIYKTGSEGFSNTGLEPCSEFMAAEVAGRMRGVDTVAYGLEEFKGCLCSTCRLFTDESTGFVPAYRLYPPNKCAVMVDAFGFCRDMGFEREFCDMIVLDAVTFNQDRHLGNFGFLMDNDTFALRSFTPLFDFNRSMLCFAAGGDLETDAVVAGYFRREGVGHKLGGDFAEAARALMTQERRERMPEAAARLGFDSADGKSGFLTTHGIEEIKSVLAKDIFEQDLITIYQRQTQRRDELTEDAEEVMRQLTTEMQNGSLENQHIAELMTELAQRLRHTSGKKQYGYLSPPLKSWTASSSGRFGRRRSPWGISRMTMRSRSRLCETRLWIDHRRVQF